MICLWYIWSLKINLLYITLIYRCYGLCIEDLDDLFGLLISLSLCLDLPLFVHDVIKMN